MSRRRVKKARTRRGSPDLSDATKHVAYEIEMFFRQGRLCLKSEFSGATLNALQEAFFLHARALHEFLYAPSARDSTVLAKDFLPDWETRRPQEPQILAKPSALRGRINKQIMHITYEREQLHRLSKKWPVKDILDAMSDPLGEFERLVAAADTTKLSERFRKAVQRYCRK